MSLFWIESIRSLASIPNKLKSSISTSNLERKIAVDLAAPDSLQGCESIRWHAEILHWIQHRFSGLAKLDPGKFEASSLLKSHDVRSESVSASFYLCLKKQHLRVSDSGMGSMHSFKLSVVTPCLIRRIHLAHCRWCLVASSAIRTVPLIVLSLSLSRIFHINFFTQNSYRTRDPFGSKAFHTNVLSLRLILLQYPDGRAGLLTRSDSCGLNTAETKNLTED
jgi:hypothetical protein